MKLWNRNWLCELFFNVQLTVNFVCTCSIAWRPKFNCSYIIYELMNILLLRLERRHSPINWFINWLLSSPTHRRCSRCSVCCRVGHFFLRFIADCVARASKTCISWICFSRFSRTLFYSNCSLSRWVNNNFVVDLAYVIRLSEVMCIIVVYLSVINDFEFANRAHPHPTLPIETRCTAFGFVFAAINNSNNTFEFKHTTNIGVSLKYRNEQLSKPISRTHVGTSIYDLLYAFYVSILSPWFNQFGSACVN